jgi:Cytochrome bd terminal oxidase subunit I
MRVALREPRSEPTWSRSFERHERPPRAVGFTVVDGKRTKRRAARAVLSPAFPQMALHSTLSTYVATGFAVAGVYALGVLCGRRDDYHRSGSRSALPRSRRICSSAGGDITARNVGTDQPEKLAAMERLFETQKGAPLSVGGVPDPKAGELRWAILSPNGLSGRHMRAYRRAAAVNSASAVRSAAPTCGSTGRTGVRAHVRTPASARCRRQGHDVPWSSSRLAASASGYGEPSSRRPRTQSCVHFRGLVKD